MFDSPPPISTQVKKDTCKPSGFDQIPESISTEQMPIFLATNDANKLLKCLSSEQQIIIRKTFGLKSKELFTGDIGTSDDWENLGEKLKLIQGSKANNTFLNVLKNLEIHENSQGSEEVVEPVEQSQGQQRSQELDPEGDAIEDGARASGINNAQTIKTLRKFRLNKVDLPK